MAVLRGSAALKIDFTTRSSTVPTASEFYQRKKNILQHNLIFRESHFDRVGRRGYCSAAGRSQQTTVMVPRLQTRLQTRNAKLVYSSKGFGVHTL